MKFLGIEAIARTTIFSSTVYIQLVASADITFDKIAELVYGTCHALWATVAITRYL